ncbi:hypothetical protein D9756_003862 [Leucocoprinus leucothites]|uniref:Ribosome biogenesis protein SLX9 n=1 Tax=Leucocoprinus leucothites TaxID=201217 RepID=A0A8H5D9K4_9AGAR|nr:hypothetical protein D9756_003862 [Leucoagaricus leucothites]
MPKEHKSRAAAHEPSVKLSKRSFAVRDNVVEHVEIGAAAEASGNEILAALGAAQTPQETLTKKERQALKREAFLHSQSRLPRFCWISIHILTAYFRLSERLELGALKTPYSKSHTRRVKRKAKEQLAGGGLNDIQAILSTIAADEDEADAASQPGENATKRNKDSSSMETDQQDEKNQSQTQQRAGKIGESNTVPLSKNQRKRALQTEMFRQPLIRSNPEFAKNPFATIRTHAQNTLIRHQPPS